MASLGHLVRLSSILFALICRSACSTAENASIRSMDSNPLLSRMNTKIPKKQQQQQPRSSSGVVPGSSPVVSSSSSLVARNSTRLTVRAIPKHSILNRPSENSFFDRESVTIRCRVKCIVSRLEDLPTVSFDFQIAEGTVLPLSSGMPGVDIFISATHSRRQRPYRDRDDARAITTYRSDTHLTLDSSAILLRPGRNSFVCSAYSPSTGRRRADRFVVHLPPPPL